MTYYGYRDENDENAKAHGETALQIANFVTAGSGRNPVNCDPHNSWSLHSWNHTWTLI
jgi:hypothetical protein